MEAAMADVEFFFDPVCPFCWVTAGWVRNVRRERSLDVSWRPLSLRLLNESIGYEGRPAAYPQVHQRGLEMLRVVVATRARHGAEAIDGLYASLGATVWDAPAPEEASFEAVLERVARPPDLAAALDRAGLPGDLADAAADASLDEELRSETDEAVSRAGGGVGTPVLSFDPPGGPTFFGPVIDRAPEGAEAMQLWDAMVTMAHSPGFAELKRSLRSFPDTPLSSRLAGHQTRARAVAASSRVAARSLAGARASRRCRATTTSSGVAASDRPAHRATRWRTAARASGSTGRPSSCCSARSAPVHRPATVGRSWVVTAARAWVGHPGPGGSGSNHARR
jgi:2-hydroxychromene-2-carboxylate isomerase